MSEARVVRTGSRRRARWTYVVDRYNGSRWRLDGTTVDLEFDRLSGGCALRGAWALFVGDHEYGAVDHFLDGSMEFVEHVVDGKYDPPLHWPQQTVPGWIAPACESVAASGADGNE